MKSDILPIGTETNFGKIESVGCISGERYYWIIDEHGTVSMMPEIAVFKVKIYKE